MFSSCLSLSIDLHSFRFLFFINSIYFSSCLCISLSFLPYFFPSFQTNHFSFQFITSYIYSMLNCTSLFHCAYNLLSDTTIHCIASNRLITLRSLTTPYDHPLTNPLSMTKPVKNNSCSVCAVIPRPLLRHSCVAGSYHIRHRDKKQYHTFMSLRYIRSFLIHLTMLSQLHCIMSNM